MTFKTLEWTSDRLVLLDQRKLPLAEEYVECESVQEVAYAICHLIVRGAPAIGVAAAYGLVLAIAHLAARDKVEWKAQFENAKDLLFKSRPTAMNLFGAVARMDTIFSKNQTLGCEALKASMLAEAHLIHNEDIVANDKIGEFGKELICPGDAILTICNAGALATTGIGTALGVVRKSWEAYKNIHVYALETRPVLQGARLTVWELMRDHIPVTLITDSMAAALMAQKKIQKVVVGADRVAANGDFANKIGTYGLAVLAKYHQIPFLCAFPHSTVDMACPSAREIPIEIRPAEEVLFSNNQSIAPADAKVYNPAFDTTPASLVFAHISDRGVILSPSTAKMAAVFGDI